MKFRVEKALGCFEHASGSMDVDEFLQAEGTFTFYFDRFHRHSC